MSWKTSFIDKIHNIKINVFNLFFSNRDKIFRFSLLWWFSFVIVFLLNYIFLNYLDFTYNLSYLSSLIIITFFNFFMSLKKIFRLDYHNNILIKYIFALVSISILNYISWKFLLFLFGENRFYYIIFFVTLFFFFVKFFVYNKFVFIKK